MIGKNHGINALMNEDSEQSPEIIEVNSNKESVHEKELEQNYEQNLKEKEEKLNLETQDVVMDENS